jgi:Fe-S-cluster containining protein
MLVSAPKQPWYGQGLRFECTRCGNCCSGAPGYVWVTLDECRLIAQALRLALEEFLRRHVRRVGTRLSLLEKRGGDCEFLVRTPDGPTTCAIHAARPVQCRTWPFWPSNVESEQAWQAAARECPGINRGLHHPLPVVQAQVAANRDLPL